MNSKNSSKFQSDRKTVSNSHESKITLLFRTLILLNLAKYWYHNFRGVPQIEVTFEVDANGILHVTAEDKAAKNHRTITITNDKGRLSQEEIDRLVKEAEEYAEEDKKIKERVEARNKLETYIYNMKSTINDKDKLGDKIDSDDKEKVESALKEALEWMDDNQDVEKDEFDEKMKEVEAVCNPVIRQVYEKSSGSSADSDDDESNDEL